ncbi:hypothetical protein Pan241w_11320 [Gimesia alba]|uniref:Uncharacterized protein n=1 Tax=Gimesia alba TaxID=2527973 RepID=A0A517RB94_9PLAN|nr:hypothetical protein Pan241w_11320 [Gimesia alba]
MPADQVNCNNISLSENNRNQSRRAHDLLDQAILEALQSRSGREVSRISVVMPKHGSKLGNPKLIIESS